MARVVTPGGRVGDDASLDRSPRANWVEKRGGLPRYIRIVANALIEKRGFTREHAIRTAINAMRKWAAKSTDPAVKAAAAGTSAEWEAIKLSAGDLLQVIELAATDDYVRRSMILDLADASPAQARATVKGHYPPDTLRWMKAATWTRERVPLAKVTRKARPADPRNPAKVEAIAEKIRSGKTLKPVLLVRRPGATPDDIADGYHRTEALRRLGRTHVDAYVAHGAPASGPWEHEMHARKLNLAEPVVFVIELAQTVGTGAAPVGAAPATSSSGSRGSSGRTWDESKHPRKGGKFAPKGTQSTSGGAAKLSPEQQAQIRQYQAEHGLPVTGSLDASTVNYAKEGKARRYQEAQAKKAAAEAKKGQAAADKAARDAKREADKRAREAERVAREQQRLAQQKQREAEKAKRDAEAARVRKDKAAAAAASRVAAEALAAANAAQAAAGRLRQQAANASAIQAQQVSAAQYGNTLP